MASGTSMSTSSATCTRFSVFPGTFSAEPHAGPARLIRRRSPGNVRRRLDMAEGGPRGRWSLGPTTMVLLGWSDWCGGRRAGVDRGRSRCASCGVQPCFQNMGAHSSAMEGRSRSSCPSRCGAARFSTGRLARSGRSAMRRCCSDRPGSHRVTGWSMSRSSSASTAESGARRGGWRTNGWRSSRETPASWRGPA
jgi:hypothetical protein